MALLTRRQDLAQEVFECATRADLQSHRAEYGAYAVQLAAMIRLNGLAQTLDFLADKASAASGKPRPAAAAQLCADLLAVLRGNSDADPGVSGLDAFDYLVISRRALEAADYFKRFAESVLDADRSDRREDQ